MVRRLTDQAFHATFKEPMDPVPKDAAPPFDFWSYFEAIPASDFEGADCSDGRVENAWSHPDGLYQHVLVMSKTPNVFMVLVLDLQNDVVLGHHLLDLNREYGLDG